MSKLEKIYAGFYGYKGYSIERKSKYGWHVYSRFNRCVCVRYTLKECVEVIDSKYSNIGV